MSRGEAFVQWVFSKNSTTACPTWTQAFACPAPKACGRNPANLRQFCCETESRICWGPRATCASDGSTVTCGTGNSTWCCVSGSEICTQAPGQINICWSTTESIIQNISVDSLRDTYSSLSSASPAASSFSFDPQAMIAATATTSSSIRTSPTSSPTNSATDNSSPGGSASSQNSGVPSSPVASSDSGLGGGAIAGIVVGVLGALALGAVIGYFVLRAMKKKREAVAPPPTDPYMSMASPPGGGPGGPGGLPAGAVYPPYGQYQATELAQKWEYQQHPGQGQGQLHSPYSATTAASPVQAQELPAQRESYAEMPAQRYT